MSKLHCPKCLEKIYWDYIKSEFIEVDDVFECPKCKAELVLVEDESDSLYHDNVSRLELWDESESTQ